CEHRVNSRAREQGRRATNMWYADSELQCCPEEVRIASDPGVLMAEPRRVTLVVERGQMTFRRHDFLACRHHFVACRHHAAATLGAVLTDSALFVSIRPSGPPRATAHACPVCPPPTRDARRP